PPSIAFVVYGIITEESIGRLFMAGMVPGVVTAVGYILTIMLALRLQPGLAPQIISRAKEALEPVQVLADDPRGRVWPVVLLVVLIMGALYSGVATPTE